MMAEPPRLYGLKALVTSAAAGIGEAICRTLAKHGAEVLAVDGINTNIEKHYLKVRGVTGIAAALADSARIPAMVEAAVEHLGEIDILVNDFPARVEAPLSAADQALDKLLETRAGLIMAACHAVLPYMKRSPAGRIINIGCLRSVFAATAAEAYQKAESDLAVLTRAIAVEAAEFGITANYIQPGAIMTPVSREVFRKDKTLRDYCIARSAARRLGEPVDIAKVALFLASDDSTFVSGTGIVVDGGRAGGG
jgi:NAD(P)-dependent dehydrogenase (short-subunit alcohol dehydrogenase family)